MASVGALGTEAVLAGKKARAFPLRFVDGAVFLGPLKGGDVPPLSESSFMVLAKICLTTDRYCGMISGYRRDGKEQSRRARPSVMEPALSLGNVSAQMSV